MTYSGDDAAQHLLKYLKALEPLLIAEIDNIQKLVWTKEARADFDNRTSCYACSEILDPSELFADHCHATGIRFF